MPFVFRTPLLCECHRPFRFPRPNTAPTTTRKRELSLANTLGEFDAGNRDGRVLNRLEARHRCTASLDRPMILFNQVIEIFVCPHFDIPPARMLTSQKPQRATAGNVSIERYFARQRCRDRAGAAAARTGGTTPGTRSARDRPVSLLSVATRSTHCETSTKPYMFDIQARCINHKARRGPALRSSVHVCCLATGGDA
jgi:hypothetical protein